MVLAESSWYFNGSPDTQALFLEFMGYIMKNGFCAGILNGMAPTQSTPAGMSVAINTGVAWINGSIHKVSVAGPVTIEAADATYPRIDRVVIRHSPASNSNIITVLKGTPAAVPAATALTQTTSTWEIAICDVAVAANATSIVTANITDYRLNALGGLAYCNLGQIHIDPDGALDAAGKPIHYLLAPVSPNDAATKAYADTKAPFASPTFTGTPLAPTAVAGTNNTQIATAAFVQTALGTWANWTPTLGWTGTTPSGITTKARYVKIGKTIYIQFNCKWTAGNGTTGLAVTGLPGTLVATNDRVPLPGYGVYESNGTRYYSPNAFIETSASAIYFWSFTANASSAVGAVNLAGFYEVS